MKLPELNTPCSREEAAEIVKQFRLYMANLDSASIWKIEPEEFDEENRFVSCPCDPICWVDMVNGAITLCRLAILYQKRSNGTTKLFLSNIIPDASLRLNPLPRDMYCKIASKFHDDIWLPFLQSIRFNKAYGSI